MADTQAAGKKNSGKNCTTSVWRKQRYAAYKLRHGNCQHNHPSSSMRSPLNKISRRRVVVNEYYKNYKLHLNDEVMEPLPFDPATVRMLREHGVDRKYIHGLKA